MSLNVNLQAKKKKTYEEDDLELGPRVCDCVCVCRSFRTKMNLADVLRAEHPLRIDIKTAKQTN